MTVRNASLQFFVDAARDAFLAHAADEDSRRVVRQVFKALEIPADAALIQPEQLLPCVHLPAALRNGAALPGLRNMLKHFAAVEPHLQWTRRPKYDPDTVSRNFLDGHANTMIIGPGGWEQRTDLWLGASLLAPQVRYTDHNHAPEETYLVASEGEFHQEGRWFQPGIGGSFYNRPWIKHGMRSGDAPLLAFWALHPEE